MKFLKDVNWGLRLLALILAIVVYYALKDETSATKDQDHEKHLFQYR